MTSDALTTTVNLADEAQTIKQDRLPPVEDELAAVKAEAEDVRADEGVGSDAWEELEQRFAELTARKDELEVQATALERATEKWGGETGDAVFTIKELDFGEVGRAQYETTKKSAETDGDASAAGYHSSYYQTMVLRLGIQDSPAAAPDDPQDYTPWKVAEYLYDQIDNLSTYGDRNGEGADLGNSSLLAATRNSSNA